MSSLSIKSLKKMVDKLYHAAVPDTANTHVGEMYELEFIRRNLHQALDDTLSISQSKQEFIEKWIHTAISERSIAEMLNEHEKMLIAGLFTDTE